LSRAAGRLFRPCLTKSFYLSMNKLTVRDIA
jgi:hypothetical protein